MFTSVFLNQRLSTIIGADQILVINDGRIAERGRWVFLAPPCSTSLLFVIELLKTNSVSLQTWWAAPEGRPVRRHVDEAAAGAGLWLLWHRSQRPQVWETAAAVHVLTPRRPLNVNFKKCMNHFKASNRGERYLFFRIYHVRWWQKEIPTCGWAFLGQILWF